MWPASEATRSGPVPCTTKPCTCTTSSETSEAPLGRWRVWKRSGEPSNATVRSRLTYIDRERADERTRTADLVSLRVIHQALQGCAGDCKSRVTKGFSVHRLARCCTVLRSRWYQNGINTGIAASRSCLVVAFT